MQYRTGDRVAIRFDTGEVCRGIIGQIVEHAERTIRTSYGPMTFAAGLYLVVYTHDGTIYEIRSCDERLIWEGTGDLSNRTPDVTYDDEARNAECHCGHPDCGAC